MQDMNKILEVKNIKKIYHTLTEEILAIDDISFEIIEGEILSIVGPSGCGKSTLLSIVNNLVEKSSGDVIKSKDVTMAYMLQDDCLLNFRTILDNCLIGLEITKNLSDESIGYVKNLLANYGLKDFMDRYPAELSGGMRQRCALIRTLALKPDILLLDEALSALDYQNRLTIGNDIYKIIKQEKITAVMVTHDINEAIRMSDKVIVLTNRPARVKNIYDIRFTKRSTPIDCMSEPEFSHYFNQIWRDLDARL